MFIRMNRRRYLGVLGLGAFVAGCLDDQEAETEPQEGAGEESGQPDEDGEETDQSDDDDSFPSGEERAPTMAISAEADTSFSYSENDEVLIQITHETGDELDLENVEIVLRGPDEFVPPGEDDDDEDDYDGPVATFSAETGWHDEISSSSADAEELVLRLNGAEIEAGDTFAAGDTLTIEVGADADAAALETLDDGAEHSVVLVHKPSDSEVGLATVFLPPANG